MALLELSAGTDGEYSDSYNSKQTEGNKKRYAMHNLRELKIHE